ncbi:xanthine dehydrogenase family protein subunit M [Gramella lutea]|uniref:Xanthine dehydrogenase family protein subunit M n=1 Tax=Christiangramia lutea TaxID=1607951 RepID=A0A9X1V2X6_9FLAO|nr:xanthine dehydrogenase family protein subunit M [Christiangramia lutea]MCH4823203.1 xanthine dehydrogenase family protein subunit M [Christiangramia lutea]
MKPFEYSKAENTTSAIKLAGNSSMYISGGTNLIDLMKKHIHEPDKLIDLTDAVSSEITVQENGIRIGAMVRNSTLAEDSLILDKFPLLSRAILKGASPQIRNMASTGGNLLQRTRCPYFYDTALPCNKRIPGSGCGALEGNNRMSAVIGYSNSCVAVHPSDMCVALVALDTKVEILKPDGNTEMINFEDFHRLPGDNPQKDNNLPDGAIITAIEIQNNSFNKNYDYLKLRERESYAFALISVAAALELSGNLIREARLASGGVAHKPWRWKDAENFLKGENATEENFKKAAELAIEKIAPLEDNKFKTEMLKGAIQQSFMNCVTNR